MGLFDKFKKNKKDKEEIRRKPRQFNQKVVKKPTREEVERSGKKLKEELNSSKHSINIMGTSFGDNEIKINKEFIKDGEVKFKGFNKGFDLNKIISQEIDDSIIKEYGTNEEKIEMEIRLKKKDIKKQKSHILHKKLEKANKLLHNHDYNNAIFLYREIIDASEFYDSTVALAYTDLTNCYLFSSRYDDAIEVINEDIEINRYYGQDVSKLESKIGKIKKSEINSSRNELRKKGLDLFYSEEYDEAMIYFKKCVELNDDDSKTYQRLTDIYIRKKDFNSAKEVLETGIGNVTWDYGIHNEHNEGLADRLDDLNNFLETGRFKWEHLPVDSTITKSEIKNAKAVLKNGDVSDGIELLEKIIKKGTYSNTVYYTLYQTYMKNKNYDDAIRISDLAINTLGSFDADRFEKWSKYKVKALDKKSENT